MWRRVGIGHSALRLRQPLDHAEALVLAGRYGEARQAYTAVLVDGVGADRALLGLARLSLDPTNPEKDDRDAAAYLDRLIAQYPRSPSVPEARRWVSLLQQVGRLQQELRRQQSEVERLRRTLQREQQETARLREERERLRQIDGCPTTNRRPAGNVAAGRADPEATGHRQRAPVGI